MKRLTLLSCFILACILSMQVTFASSGDISKPQTLLEMQEEKEKLEQQGNILQFKWNTFQLGNESLGDIMKPDLDQESRIQLEEIISVYVNSKKELDSDLAKSISSGREIEDIKRDLLTQKHVFYKNLIPFIQIKKLESFKKYVNSDLNLNEENKNIQNQIDQKNVEQSERLEELRDQIDNNSRSFRKKIEETITVQVTEKLEIFVMQDTFSRLPNETKSKIFRNMTHKFETAISRLGDTVNPTRVVEERIIALEVVVEILESYMDNWK